MTVYTITSLASGFVTGLDNDIDPSATSVSSVQVASLLLGTILPILVALVTKHNTDPKIKAFILAALSALSGFLTEFINSNNFVWQQALLTTVMTFVVAVATHFGLWAPTGASDAALSVGENNNEGGGVDNRMIVIVAAAVVVVVILFLVL